MDIRPIRSEEEYEAALKEIEQIFDAEPGTPEGDKLEVLAILVEQYEEKHYPTPLPDPIEAIKYHMERLELTRKDLEPFIGRQSRISEILNRKRPLTLNMMRNLNTGLGISMEILAQTYALEDENKIIVDDYHDAIKILEDRVATLESLLITNANFNQLGLASESVDDAQTLGHTIPISALRSSLIQ